MRKQFLLIMILCLSTTMVWAERIDVSTARKVAENVVNAGSSLRSAGDLSLVYAAAPGRSSSALRSGTVDGAADYFVFNVPGNKGFVIVSGEDRAYPVLGQSDEGNFDPNNLPENLRAMLAYYQDQITWAEREGQEASANIQAEWNRYLNGNLRASSESVLLETANWNQEDPYNRQTPTINGLRTYTGCVATATGIIMQYHKYPKTVVSGGVTTYDGLPVTYAPYDWDQMPLNYTKGNFTDTQANAVAALMWNIGANVNMDYGAIGSGGSGAITRTAVYKLNSLFGYSDGIVFVSKEDYRWNEWKTMLRTELDNNRPVLYSGRTQRNEGHAFICDGYKENEAFHINWGWGGYLNGYFLLTVLDPDGSNEPYSSEMDMAIGVRPPVAGDTKIYQLRYSSLEPSISPLPVGSDISISVGVKNVGNDEFKGYVDIAVIDANGNMERIGTPVEIDSPFDSYYISTSNVQCRLTKTLADTDKILPVYSTDGINWEIMGGRANAPLYINKNGVINEGDDPNDPIVKPVNVNIYWNQFDDSFLSVSGLDNSQYNSENTQGISYRLTNVTENIILRYVLKDYAAWDGQLAVYYGDNYSIDQPNQGTGVVIKDGTFEVKVSLGQSSKGSYINYLKILSAKAGELAYDIQVYTESDKINPVFEEKGKSMIFLNNVEGKINPNPVIGTVNTEIPFDFTLNKVDPSLIGKELKLKPSLFMLSKGQIKLYYIDGAQKIEIELEAGSSGTYFPAKEPVAVGNLTVGRSYRFVLSSSQIIPKNEGVLSVDVEINGKSVPSTSENSQLIISEAPIIVHKVQMNLQHLSVQNEVTSAIDGKPLLITLLPNEGYQLPSSISITMGGGVLDADQYRYYPEGGNISIDNVTGDVVITAKADPIRVATHPVRATLTNLSSSPAITDATIVKEGEPFSITLSANKGYMLPESITIKMSGAILEAGKEYTYDAKTGKVEILDVKGEIAITAEAAHEPSVYTITAELKNLTSTPAITSATTVKEGESFTFTLMPNQDYKLPDAIVILNASQILTSEEYTYDAKTGKVVIKAVTNNLTVKASGIDDRHYEVILNLTGITSEPASFDPVLVNGKVELALKAAEGHTLPATVTVTMGGKTLVGGTDYTYNASTGTFSLSKITGKLSITAQGVKKSYPVTVSLVNITSDIPTNAKVIFGEAFACKLSADEGYTLPTKITVVMDGKTLVDVSDYTYDTTTGKLSLEKVTGELAITAQGVKKSYAVTVTLKDLTSDILSSNKIEHGETLAGTLSVMDALQYMLPSTIEVTMGGKVLSVGSGYSYDPKTGAIEIKNVTAEVSIKATGTKIFQVKEQTENIGIKLSGEIAKEGEPFKCELVPATGYKFPYVIKVMMGGRLLKQKNLLRAAGSEYYTYNNTTGIIEIENVNGDIFVEAKGVQEGFFEIIPNLINLTSDPASFEPLAKDSKVELRLKAVSNYTLPASITVTMGNKTLTSVDYTYNSITGNFTLEKITGTLVITAAGNRIPEPEPEPEPEPTPTTYTVTLPLVEGAVLTAESSTNVISGNGFAFTLTLKEGYSASNLTVKANGSVLIPVSNGRYAIEKVTNNIVVTVTGIVKDNPTGNTGVGVSGLKVWGENGKLHIQTPIEDTAYIVTFDGRLYKSLSLPVGETVTNVPQDSYIIYIGNQSYKIRF